MGQDAPIGEGQRHHGKEGAVDRSAHDRPSGAIRAGLAQQGVRGVRIPFDLPVGRGQLRR
jgi:hypothetical protein